MAQLELGQAQHTGLAEATRQALEDRILDQRDCSVYCEV
jgi:hypothetical protein